MVKKLKALADSAGDKQLAKTVRDSAQQIWLAGLGAFSRALATDSSSLTACGNDYDFETYYARMAETLGRPGDVLIGITTSGRSPNIVRALQAARKKGIKTIGLLGGDGGPALAECDLALVVPSKETGRIQEAHIAIGHAAMELIEDRLIAAGIIANPSSA